MGRPYIFEGRKDTSTPFHTHTHTHTHTPPPHTHTPLKLLVHIFLRIHRMGPWRDIWNPFSGGRGLKYFLLSLVFSFFPSFLSFSFFSSLLFFRGPCMRGASAPKAPPPLGMPVAFKCCSNVLTRKREQAD